MPSGIQLLISKMSLSIKMSKLLKHILTIVISLILINAFMNFLLLPYVQETANKHMNIANFVAFILMITSVFILIIGGGLITKAERQLFHISC